MKNAGNMVPGREEKDRVGVRAALLGRIKVPEEVVREVDDYLRSSATLVRPADVSVRNLTDRSDLPILGAAVSSGAAYLITGDGELLKLRQVDDTAIVSSRAFWEKMKSG